MPKATSLSEVPKDFEPNKVKGVYNPTKEDITIKYGGVPFVVKAGEYAIHPEPLAYHLAKHIAIFIQNKGLNEFLLDNYPGLTEQGREKWKVNTTHFVSKQDILELRDKLVFDHKIGEAKPPMDEAKPKYAAKKKTVETPVVEKEPEDSVEDQLAEKSTRGRKPQPKE